VSAERSPEVQAGDFTEDEYRRLVRLARTRYRFEPYATTTEAAHVIWRHDVDASPHRAARLAAIEAQEGARSVFCFLLHSPFYNLLEREVADRARAVLELGHGLGLHFDTAFYGEALDEPRLGQLVRREATLLGELFDRPVEAVSFHNPDVADDLAYDADRLGGLPNAYGRSLRKRYSYVSDSNGYWRFRRLRDVLEEGAERRLHVLTHPEWWTPDPATPRERIVRCVEGRSVVTLEGYDSLLASAGRRNIA
jgi:hypothetical protein